MNHLSKNILVALTGQAEEEIKFNKCIIGLYTNSNGNLSGLYIVISLQENVVAWLQVTKQLVRSLCTQME